MNRKNYLQLIVILVIAMLNFSFASCSNDDADGWKDVQSSSEIQGVWQMGNTATGGLSMNTYTFTGNKWTKEEYYYNSKSTVSNHGTFIVSKGKITFKYEYNVDFMESKDWTTSIEKYEDSNGIWLKIGNAKYCKE